MATGTDLDSFFRRTPILPQGTSESSQSSEYDVVNCFSSKVKEYGDNHGRYLRGHPLAPVGPDGAPVPVKITEVQKYLELVGAAAPTYQRPEDFRSTVFHQLSDKVHPLFLGAVQRSLSLSRLLTERILASHLEDKEAIESVVAKLNGDYPTHSFPLMPEELAETGLNIKPMSADVSAIAYRILSYYKLLTAAGGSLTDDERESWRTLAVFESEELRTNFAYTAKERFIENTWTRWDYSAGYTHYTLLQKKKGHFEVNYLVNDQVTRWMSGEEIVVD